MQIQKIKVDQLRLGDFILDIQRGRLRIPSFQREFVWEKMRIQKLLDSMYNEYPIGTIFLWEAPPSYNHLLRDVEYLGQPEIQPGYGYTLILDGQQRLTSLYAAVNGLSIEGEDYANIVVDLDWEVTSNRLPFQYRKADNQRWIAVRDLLSSDSDVYLPIYNKLSSDNHRRKFEHYRSRLSNYPFSVVIVRDMEIQDAVEIFERINQQGRRLSRYDLIAATVLTDAFNLRERTETDIVGILKTSFGAIEETSIPQALALNVVGNTEYSTQMSLSQPHVSDRWQDTVDCFLLAVDFVRHNLGVARVDFLPYDGILPVLAHYFYHLRKNYGAKAVLSTEHRQQIEKWFWRVAFSERYSGASQTRMSEDAAWMRDLIDTGRQYEFAVTIDMDSLTEGSMTYSSSAIRNGILCLLNLLHPLDFRNAGKIEISGDHFSSFTRAEKHHIFPVGFLEKQGYTKRDKRAVHRIPNFCFIPKELNAWISDKAPSTYFQSIAEGFGDFYDFEKVMRSHLIPVYEDSGIWTDDYDLFLGQRARLLLDEVRYRCGIVPRMEEEHRNPIIDAVEVALRDAIHVTLSNSYGFDYWREGVSSVAGDVSKSITEKMEQSVRLAPGTAKSKYDDLRLRWDFCDVGDYSKIIMRGNNWRLFSPLFKSKPESERYLNDFREFRNAVKHGREIDSVLELRGQAAILWLSRVLDLDLSRYGII